MAVEAVSGEYNTEDNSRCWLGKEILGKIDKDQEMFKYGKEAGIFLIKYWVMNSAEKLILIINGVVLLKNKKIFTTRSKQYQRKVPL